MSTETIHPMVMKAAQSWFASEVGVSAKDDPQEWEAQAPTLIRRAHAALTECGALECLEALERMTYKDNFGAYRALIVAGSYLPRVAESALSNVYGSAP